MLQTTKRGPRLPLRPRSRADIGPKLRQPHVGRHVERLEGLLAHDAVDGDAVARLEAAHRRLDIGIENVAASRTHASRSPTGEQAAARSGDDARMPVADAQPLDRRHRRPAAARRDRLVLRRSPARSSARSRPTSVGSDDFGIRMVREVESNLWPNSACWFCRISALQQWHLRPRCALARPRPGKRRRHPRSRLRRVTAAAAPIAMVPVTRRHTDEPGPQRES